MTTKALVKFLNNTWSKIEKLLTKKGFKTVILENERAIRKFIYENIPDNSIVGLGSSISTSAMKIRDILLEKGNKIYYFWNGTEYNRDLDGFDELPEPDYFITSADSITEEGSIVNSEYSAKNIANKKYPKHIIAFTEAQQVAKKIQKTKMDADYVVIDQIPEETNITVALTTYSKKAS